MKVMFNTVIIKGFQNNDKLRVLYVPKNMKYFPVMCLPSTVEANLTSDLTTSAVVWITEIPNMSFFSLKAAICSPN